MIHDPFLVEDVLAAIGALCLLVTLFVIGMAVWSTWTEGRAERQRNADRADWSAGRRPI